MKIKKISQDGRIYDPQHAKIQANDLALTRGVAVFETFRISNNRVFLYDEHVARLKNSLKALCINWQVDDKVLTNWIADIAKFIDPRHDGQIRITVTGGVERPQTLIYLHEIGKQKALECSAEVSKNYYRQIPEYFYQTGRRIKTIDYVASYMAGSMAGGKPMENVLLSPDGFVCETFMANIFWSKGNKVFTPPLSLGILPGVTRAYLREKFKVNEKLARESELEAADEIWLSSSVRNIRPLNRLNEAIKPGLNGAFYKKIIKTMESDINKKSRAINKSS